MKLDLENSLGDMELFDKAVCYAYDRWMLDDPVIVGEWLERYDPKYQPVEEFIDEMADKYDLSDPNEDPWK